jgi:hypothetical protein
VHDEFLKDILSMANADIEGDKFIIIGIVKNERNEKEFKGIKKEDFLSTINSQCNQELYNLLTM